MITNTLRTHKHKGRLYERRSRIEDLDSTGRGHCAGRLGRPVPKIPEVAAAALQRSVTERPPQLRRQIDTVSCLLGATIREGKKA